MLQICIIEQKASPCWSNHKGIQVLSPILKYKLFHRIFTLGTACTFIDLAKYQVLMSTGLTSRLTGNLTSTISGNFNYRKNSETLPRSLPSRNKNQALCFEFAQR